MMRSEYETLQSVNLSADGEIHIQNLALCKEEKCEDISTSKLDRCLRFLCPCRDKLRRLLKLRHQSHLSHY